MKKNMMRRNLHQSIKKSMARYIAIVAIIALGAGIFVGLRTTKSDMINTGQRYMDEQNMFDLRLLSTYGWNKEHVQQVASLPGVEDTEGVISMDAILFFDGSNKESVYKMYAIPENVNRVYLHGGRMPQAPDECLADAFNADDSVLGKKITLSQNNTEDTLDSFTVQTFTVVGYVSSPLYMDISRGNTTLGNGTLEGFFYLPEESFQVDYYTEIAVTLPGESTVYTDAYHDWVQEEADRLEPLLQPIADERYETVLEEAEESYADGISQYEDGFAEYREGREEAFSELEDARKQLQEGEAELKKNREKMDDGLKELENNEKLLDSGRAQLTDSKEELASAKAEAYASLAQASAELIKNYKEVDSGLSQVNDGIAQIDAGLSPLDDGISQLESGLSQLDVMMRLTDTLLHVAESSLSQAETALLLAQQQGATEDVISRLEASVENARASVVEYQANLTEIEAQLLDLTQQLTQLQAQRDELTAQREQLELTKKSLEDAKHQLDLGQMELEASRVQAENEFAAAEAQIEKAELELESGLLPLENGKKELEEGEKQLNEAKAELDKGWKEYNEGLSDASKKLSDAWLELQDAKYELMDARKAIDKMSKPEVYALGRTTNMGYLALDNNSDIVEGVSAVFPLFFLLIAALVCITTMTRMVEDERTQIGTLKALGYSSSAIAGKYLAYAGSAAVLGCGLGVIIGSVVFPLVLWEAYQIIIMLGDYLLLRIDWSLCLMVVGIYTAVTLLVTWFCCHRSLKEVPAELIRPKPPTSGKSIFMEKLPFWNRISFLNKVMLRNIFRYRQRLFMMLVGIGGCTALLLTGFGIRDSIGDLADYQYDEVVLFDHEVHFTDSMDEAAQAEFLQTFKDDIENAMFYHQSSMEMSFDDQISDVNFIAAEAGIADFFNFNEGDKQLSYPGDGQALISIGMAKKMGISKGDTVIVRDGDMRELSLEVSGIFDNNVYNYIVVTPRTVQKQWEETPQVQMACIYAAEGTDVHELGADIAQYDGVMSVTVNEDVRDSVGQMLGALDLVVITVVICAALLAIIVLYNLTNINITERLREIATIKVLGFHAGETAAYVFKENLLLSVVGAVLGLGGGMLLLEFVISKIQVDMVWITARLLPLSFVWSVLITMLSAILVDVVLYFKLEKINMAEALKSVE